MCSINGATRINAPRVHLLGGEVNELFSSKHVARGEGGFGSLLWRPSRCGAHVKPMRIARRIDATLVAVEGLRGAFQKQHQKR